METNSGEDNRDTIPPSAGRKTPVLARAHGEQAELTWRLLAPCPSIIDSHYLLCVLLRACSHEHLVYESPANPEGEVYPSRPSSAVKVNFGGMNSIHCLN
jgi:hypothetical protein